MELATLTEWLVLSHVVGDANIDIKGISTDSREIGEGDLFICLPGFTRDGHDFALEAVAKGAIALVAERPVEAEVPQVIVPDVRRAVPIISQWFFDNPSQDLRLIGVTGTNGKTTTTHLIHHILTEWSPQKKAGLIGSNDMRVGEKPLEMHKTTPTTPEAIDLQRIFHTMRGAGAKYVVMEVSSHALDQGRVNGSQFRTAVFTNLTQDHLDYHKTMAQYRHAKEILFSRLGGDYKPNQAAFAVLNADDEASQQFAWSTCAQVVTYGIEHEADVRAVNLHTDARHTVFDVHTFRGNTHVDFPLVGKFNVYNALAAMSVCLLEGVPLAAIKHSLERVAGVDGRLERVEEGQNFTVLVDYAHTPDSLENVLSTVCDFAEARILCVVGCGGDRDRTKRPLMAKIAVSYSDFTVLTSDNPRSEDPDRIIDDMVEGLHDCDPNRYTIEVNREAAIRSVIDTAQPGDVVLIPGKGHETYQEINGKRYDFDDREVARQALQQRLHEA